MATVLEKTVDRTAKDIFSDFLTIAVHSLLHSRQVYPVGAFKLRQKFNIPVQVCYHPDVFSYITDMVASISRLLHSGQFHALHFYVGTPKADWEQVTIRLLAFSVVRTQTQLNSLTSALRSCLLKLSIIETYLPRRVSGDITWRIEIDAADKEVETNHTEWLKVEPDDQGKTSSVRKIIPLKTTLTDCVKLEMFITNLA